ncbi:hypothetical protein [uncultured Methylovirgula sp.]|uniref:hypothetical protein n=1 Tax=uncultured Methylovirgula sp. TaxID=1285960 RepID=UPI002610F578|nr:hypothetical protein [uncultured Methylovirgula sp.]
MSPSKIILTALCAAAIGFAFTQSGRSQGMSGQGGMMGQGMMGQGTGCQGAGCQGMGGQGMMAMKMGKYIAIAGTAVNSNVTSVWLLNPADKQIIACNYKLDAGITCVKQDLP